jgi:hypothetical protein
VNTCCPLCVRGGPPAAPALARGGSLVQVLEAGTIEDDGAAYLQVDFANAFLGGGVLGSGCVQVNPPTQISFMKTSVAIHPSGSTGAHRTGSGTGKYSDLLAGRAHYEC